MSYDDNDFLRDLEKAVAKLDLPDPTPAQLAVRARNHERLIRLGFNSKSN